MPVPVSEPGWESILRLKVRQNKHLSLFSDPVFVEQAVEPAT
jgi:hypothetical protein